MKITPFGNNILLKPTQKKQILVSDQGSLCEYGEVLAIGSDVKNVKVGDVIGFLVWGINSLQVENDKYFFIPESADFILGTIEVSRDMVASV